MEKEEIIKKIREVDISQEDWVADIHEQITDKYAKGYLSAKLEDLSNSMSTHDEDFRIDFINYCDYDIWGK